MGSKIRPHRSLCFAPSARAFGPPPSDRAFGPIWIFHGKISFNDATISFATRGVSSDGLKITVLPATKAGIIQMTKYFAVHLADYGIRVNAISPGGIYNPENPQSEYFINEYSKRNPMGRMGKSNELLGALFYFSSGTSSYVTGHNLVVDGGMSCW